jgi:N-acetylneuraminic acid mutarotase
MATGRWGHTATLLLNGKVLVAGGTNVSDTLLASAELYDPATENWSDTGSLRTSRANHTATLLPNGKVLVAGGGYGDDYSLASAELYDPATGTWSYTGSLSMGRLAYTATLLTDGRVLATGGSMIYNPLTTAELYYLSPARARFIPAIWELLLLQ